MSEILIPKERAFKLSLLSLFLFLVLFFLLLLSLSLPLSPNQNKGKIEKVEEITKFWSLIHKSCDLLNGRNFRLKENRKKMREKTKKTVRGKDFRGRENKKTGRGGIKKIESEETVS